MIHCVQEFPSEEPYRRNFSQVSAPGMVLVLPGMLITGVFLFFYFFNMACWVFPEQLSNHVPPALGGWVLITRPPGEVLVCS